MEPEYLRRTEDYFEAASGRKLFFRSWQPSDPSRVMVLVHGFGEHSGRYEDTASWFAHQGFAVYAHDQLGHGRSPGKRGHVDQFDDLLDDVECLTKLANRTHPDRLRVLVGHSMGGLIVTALACERQLDVDLVAASGPALVLSPDISRVKLWLASILQRFIPRLAMSAGLDPNALSTDQAVVREYVADPLVHSQITASLAAGMTNAVRRLQGAAANLRLPMLILHGEADPICEVAGSRAFHASSLPDSRSRTELLTYPGLLHEIFNEPDRVRVYSDLLSWIRRMESR